MENKKLKNRAIYLVYRIFIFVIILLIMSAFSFLPANRYIPPQINDTIVVYDSVWVNDTLFIYKNIYITFSVTDSVPEDNIANTDTLMNDVTESDSLPDYDIVDRDFIYPTSISRASYKTPFERVVTFPNYTIGTEIMPMGFTALKQFSTTNNEIKTLYNNSLKQRQAFSTGGFVELTKNRYSIHLGTYSTKFYEKLNYSESSSEIFPISYYNIFDVLNWNVDTIMFLNLDSLLAGDTVWEPYYDTIKYTLKDSTFINTYDTITNNTKYNLTNTYTFFEIPIIFGYKINFNRFSFSFKAGIITSFFISSKGFNISYHNKYIVSKNEYLNFSKVFFSSYFSSKFAYKINPNIGLYFEPFYRFPLSKTYSNNLVVSKFTNYGVKIGVQYTFGL